MSEQEYPFDKERLKKLIDAKEYDVQLIRERTEPDTQEGVGKALRESDSDMMIMDWHPLSPVNQEIMIKLHDRELGESVREFTWEHFKVSNE